MVEFWWNGRRLEGREGDSLAVALWRNGIRAPGSSRKRHRPLGYSGSFVQGTLAKVEGLPNARLDRTALRPGLRAWKQNTWPGPRFDLLRLFRLLPARRVRGGFEHPRLLPSGTRRFERWERLLSFLAGEGRLSPAAPEITMVPGRRLAADAVVVGGGPAGRAEAETLLRAGKRVVLVSRGELKGAPAGATLLPAHEAFGAYRGGRLLAAAPFDAAQGAVVIEAAELVLATGRRSCPPLVAGNDLPGVLEARTALHLAERGCDLGRVVVIGTGAEAELAARLGELKAQVVATAPAAALRRIAGRSRVTAAELDRRVACDTLVHAGPWIGEGSLAFQAAGDGIIRLLGGTLPPGVRRVGAAAAADEAPPVGDLAALRSASVCPCMDVQAAEILDLAAGGMTHVEELKRQTGCGMGPCQGQPCWSLLGALLAKAGYEGTDRPSRRGPRAALTVAQAAGLADLVEPQQ